MILFAGRFSEFFSGCFTVFHRILPGRFTAVQSQQLHLSADCYRVVCLLKKITSVDAAKSLSVTGLEQDCVAFCPHVWINAFAFVNVLDMSRHRPHDNIFP